MLYDLADGPPEPGSLLESIFLLVSLRRREAELFQTEALIAAIVGSTSQNYEAIEKSLVAYKNSIFPFLEAEKSKKGDMAKEALKQWTSHKALVVRPIGLNTSDMRKASSRLKKQVEANKANEAQRKAIKHTRI